MNGLVDNAGKLRLKNVGIVKGSKIEHIAPNGDMVRGLMNNLFKYLKKDHEISLIKVVCSIMSWSLFILLQTEMDEWGDCGKHLF